MHLGSRNKLIDCNRASCLLQAVYELACGEDDLVKDLLMIQKNYADPLVQLHILTSSEVMQLILIQSSNSH